MFFIKKVFIIEEEEKNRVPVFSFNLFILSKLQCCFYEGENDRNTGNNNTGKLKNQRQAFIHWQDAV